MYRAHLRKLIFASTDEYFICKEGRIVPRKGHIPKRDVLKDPIYNDKVVTKLINNIMLNGKKGVAQKICYGAFDIIKQKTVSSFVKIVKYGSLWIKNTNAVI